MSAESQTYQDIVYRYARRSNKADGYTRFCKPARGKLKYRTRGRAIAAAVDLRDILGQPMNRAYRCPFSRNPKRPHWHLTSAEENFFRWRGTASWVLLPGRRVLVHCGPAAPYPYANRFALPVRQLTYGLTEVG